MNFPPRYRAFLLFFLLLVAGCHRGSSHATPAPASSEATASAITDSPHVLLGIPAPMGATDEHVLVRSGYVVGYSPSHLAPAWVSWRFVASDLGGTARHKGHFLTDTSLPLEWGHRVTHEDYVWNHAGLHYQRGHILPSEERTASQAANDATFLLSNVAPQTGPLNDGPWRALEKHCRSLVEGSNRQLMIVAGPSYAARPETFGPASIPVPDFFWKVIIVQAPGEGPDDVRADTSVIAVIMPNVESVAQSWTLYGVKVEAVERRSGHRFFDRVPSTMRAALEAK